MWFRLRIPVGVSDIIAKQITARLLTLLVRQTEFRHFLHLALDCMLVCLNICLYMLNVCVFIYAYWIRMVFSHPLTSFTLGGCQSSFAGIVRTFNMTPTNLPLLTINLQTRLMQIVTKKPVMVSSEVDNSLEIQIFVGVTYIYINRLTWIKEKTFAYSRITRGWHNILMWCNVT